MIAAALRFATGTIQHLPDFVAVRATRSYDNLPQASANRHVKPKVELHWTGFAHREITYRDGHELLQAADNSTAQPGFSTWGEFGPMLTIVLTDAFQGSVTWDHWERDDAGARVAVFHYTVPRSASHYSIDFCCYQESLESPWQSFREKPGYHGAITLRPDTGEITRITLDAEMKHTDAVRSSGAALDYGSVEIGGRTYQCPVRSVALSVIYSPSIEKINGEGLERHINEVAFTNYHKFGSSVRIVPAAP